MKNIEEQIRNQIDFQFSDVTRLQCQDLLETISRTNSIQKQLVQIMKNCSDDNLKFYFAKARNENVKIVKENSTTNTILKIHYEDGWMLDGFTDSSLVTKTKLLIKYVYEILNEKINNLYQEEELFAKKKRSVNAAREKLLSILSVLDCQEFYFLKISIMEILRKAENIVSFSFIKDETGNISVIEGCNIDMTVLSVSYKISQPYSLLQDKTLEVKAEQILNSCYMLLRE